MIGVARSAPHLFSGAGAARTFCIRCRALICRNLAALAAAAASSDATSFSVVCLARLPFSCMEMKHPGLPIHVRCHPIKGGGVKKDELRGS